MNACLISGSVKWPGAGLAYAYTPLQGTRVQLYLLDNFRTSFRISAPLFTIIFTHELHVNHKQLSLHKNSFVSMHCAVCSHVTLMGGI